MRDSYKRIILDIQDIVKDPIPGVYFSPDEKNITFGNIMIIGPKDTPYENGMYNFSIRFPHDYPFSPPQCTYLTNDCITRFNPNFYKSGKVCLSILNTWPGEKWSSCQTLRSLLLTLQMTMNEEPLKNEPGITDEKHKSSIISYNEIINYKNIEFAILKTYENVKKKSNVPDYLLPFQDEIIEHVEKNYEYILNQIEKKKNFNEYVSTNIYGMSCLCDYSTLLQRCNKFYDIWMT
jgi:ubiquitin-protein ligase